MCGIVYICFHLHRHVSYSELDMCIRVVFIFSKLHTALKSSNFGSISSFHCTETTSLRKTPRLIDLTRKRELRKGNPVISEIAMLVKYDILAYFGQNHM